MDIIKIIKEELENILINEKLANVDEDVNMLYNNYLAKSINIINETGRVNKSYFEQYETDTSILKSEDAVAAHNIRPAKIYVNYFRGNNYNPHTDVINFGFNNSAIDYASEYDTLKNAANDIPNGNSLLLEFTETKMKESIHHELAHWIDNVLHNNHLVNDLKKRKNLVANDSSINNVNSSYFEIEGQIHNIKQLKNKYSDTWDNLKFSELMLMSPSLDNINNSIHGDEKRKWIRDLKTRMYRENLLGKNMVNT